MHWANQILRPIVWYKHIPDSDDRDFSHRCFIGRHEDYSTLASVDTTASDDNSSIALQAPSQMIQINGPLAGINSTMWLFSITLSPSGQVHIAYSSILRSTSSYYIRWNIPVTELSQGGELFNKVVDGSTSGSYMLLRRWSDSSYHNIKQI